MYFVLFITVSLIVVIIGIGISIGNISFEVSISDRIGPELYRWNTTSNIESHNHSNFNGKFNPTLTTYLFSKRMTIKNCYWVSLLLKVEHISYKVEHISYTMGTRALPNIIHTCPRACGPWESVYIQYQAKHLCPCYNYYIHISLLCTSVHFLHGMVYKAQ